MPARPQAARERAIHDGVFASRSYSLLAMVEEAVAARAAAFVGTKESSMTGTLVQARVRACVRLLGCARVCVCVCACVCPRMCVCACVRVCGQANASCGAAIGRNPEPPKPWKGLGGWWLVASLPASVRMEGLALAWASWPPPGAGHKHPAPLRRPAARPALPPTCVRACVCRSAWLRACPRTTRTLSTQRSASRCCLRRCRWVGVCGGVWLGGRGAAPWQQHL